MMGELLSENVDYRSTQNSLFNFTLCSNRIKVPPASRTIRSTSLQKPMCMDLSFCHPKQGIKNWELKSHLILGFFGSLFHNSTWEGATELLVPMMFRGL